MSIKNKQEEQKQRGIRRTLIKSLIGLVFMFGFAFALVPIYDVLCEVTGLNGRSQFLTNPVKQKNIDKVVVDYSRKIKLQFDASNNKHVPIEFEPNQRNTLINPGDIKTFTYRVKNTTGKDMVLQAIPSTSPNEVASYLRKIECFCFNQQPLAAGEEAELSVRLYIHSSLPKEINAMTLSYTLYDITEASDFQKISVEKNARENDIDYIAPEHDDDHEHSIPGQESKQEEHNDDDDHHGTGT
ncbi:MAG: cytochrome c oxidase assembly protein [Candidatus Portiera sp.]|nr:cytochrome c oxidase assembly protein [Portiera sp.]